MFSFFCCPYFSFGKILVRLHAIKCHRPRFRACQHCYISFKLHCSFHHVIQVPMCTDDERNVNARMFLYIHISILINISFDSSLLKTQQKLRLYKVFIESFNNILYDTMIPLYHSDRSTNLF